MLLERSIVAAEPERTSDGGNPEAYSLGYAAATLRISSSGRSPAARASSCRTSSPG
jgi:hypothetical protein